MARVKVEDIIDHLDADIRKALKQAVQKTMPDTEFNDRELFRNFRRAVSRSCSVWEHVPDHYVDLD